MFGVGVGMMVVSVGVDVILAGSGVSGWCGVGGRWRGHDFRGGICGVVVAVVLADVDTVVFEGVIVIMIKGMVVILVALVVVSVVVVVAPMMVVIS